VFIAVISLKQEKMNKEKENNSSDTPSKIINFFASARLTLILIGVLAVISFLGTTQREFHPLGIYLDFRDVYHQNYYQLLMGLLFTNLLVCTIDRLPSTLRRYKADAGPQVSPPPRQEDYSFIFKNSNSQSVLEKAENIVFGQGANSLHREMGIYRKKKKEKTKANIAFVSSGRLSILGPLITHIGILLLLIGGIFGSRAHFEGSMWLLAGNSNNLVNVEGKDPVDLGFTILCNKFDVTFYDNSRMASDYLCDLSIIENGQEVSRKTIEVNQPLFHKGYGIYQASYQFQPTIKVMAESVKDGSTQAMEVDIHAQWTLDGNTYIAADYEPHMTGMGRDLGPSLNIYKINNDQTTGAVKLFEKFPGREGDAIGDWKFSFKSGQGAYQTGLQVIKDPGVPLVWLGCSLLIIGSIIAFIIQHQRIWLVSFQKGNDVELLLTGRSKKAKTMLENKLSQLAKKIESEMAP
jgi:cytochrome c biogenesis protein